MIGVAFATTLEDGAEAAAADFAERNEVAHSCCW